MPRVATTSTSRSQKLADGKVPPSPPLRVRCPESSCPWSFRTQTDLRRHMPRHMSAEEREKQMYKCPHPGCTHQSLQKSNLQTHFNSKHSGLKPHVCKKCTYCASDPSSLHRHMVAIHKYVSGTTPRKRRSIAPSSSIPAFGEPILPVSPSSDYSDYTSDAWSAGASPSPSSSAYSHFSPSPPSSSSSDEELFAFISSPPSLPTSPTGPNGWMWDAHFEEAFFPTCEKSSVVEFTPSPEPALQYPAQGIDFLAAGHDAATFLPTCFDIEQQQEPLFGDSLLFFQPPPAASYELETFSSCGFKDVVSPNAFVGEWNGALY
ncbi:hypothetical protein B0H14DRAFT_3138454 [Mycena olivaceomarginata]|nr:hypothetical protein B0H14DRAFT_3138454 [Mycena olivaceomarginata]